MAAFEGHFQTGPAALNLWGVPDAETRTVRTAWRFQGLKLPDPRRPPEGRAGLDLFPKEDWPPLGISFQSYHVMVGLGMFFIALTLFACLLRWRGTLFEHRWLLAIFVVAVVLPWPQSAWVGGGGSRAAALERVPARVDG